MSFSRTLAAEARWQDKVLGFFVLCSLGLCIYLILHQTYFQAQKKNWLTLHAVMSETFGVTPGTLVELSGVTIGNVENLKLGDDAAVRVEILIDDQYAGFLRADSRFEVKSQLGVDAVLSGVGLILIPGQASSLLNDGDKVAIQEPKSLEQIMKEMKIEEMAIQVQAIVGNVAIITETLAAQQAGLANTIDNVDKLTKQLVVVAESTPPLLETVSSSLNQVQASLVSLDIQVREVMGPARSLLESGNSLMQASTASITALEPTLKGLPSMLATTQQLLLSVDQLTRQLSRHWLFGGGAELELSVRPALLSDETLYEPVVKTATD